MDFFPVAVEQASGIPFWRTPAPWKPFRWTSLLWLQDCKVGGSRILSYTLFACAC
jgi:hypothetical protein